MAGTAQLRIGELARRTGVASELLRAWERRYGLLAPERTEGGYRLYSDDDVRQVRRMRELLASGLSAAEAARQAAVEPRAPDGAVPPDGAASAELRRALEQLDDAGGHAAFDAKCSCATETSPRSHPAPSSCRSGSTTSASTARVE